ncbi:MAG: ABC transporter ATP-binding protein [Lachnospiraceae bacterium]
MSELLNVENLSTSFKTERGMVKAVDGVSFQVKKGEIMAVVGESGCGKSVTVQSILRLYDEKYMAGYTGKIVFENQDLLSLPLKDMQSVRGRDISMIFQDALSALNPVYTVGNQIVETLRLHTELNKQECCSRAIEMIKLVGINDPKKRFKQYPFELSGGMRQRVMIAIALACEPRLLIADEPTTALDVTIQAQIMNLIIELNKKLDMGVILITHDLSVVAETCSRVVVMYLGQVVEEAEVNDIFDYPAHPYTIGLIQSIPQIDEDRPDRLFMIKGMVPLLSQIPEGCRFAPRCPCAVEKCHRQMPDLREVSPGHKVRCWEPAACKEEGRQ